LGVPFAYLAYFAVESLCLGSEGALGPLCPGGERSCDNASLPGVVPATKPVSARRDNPQFIGGYLGNEMRAAQQMRQTNPIGRSSKFEV
jgi:hypothetical protein